jgi:hypothetical protein
MSIDQQLVINNFEVLKVINDIQEDFLIYREKHILELTETQNKKNNMINRINSLHYTPIDFDERQLNYTGWIFLGDYPNPSNNEIYIVDKPQMSCDFCIKCGNYQYTTYGNKPDNIVCCCQRLVSKPLPWSREWPTYWRS